MNPAATAAGAAGLARARTDFFDALPGHFERLHMGSEELARLQAEQLRAVLHTAITRSPFHRDRLAGIEPSTFTLADLPSLPTMTKSEMMAAYDDVVTDRRLTLDVVNRHLESVGEEPATLLDSYIVLSSGGSSGVRGVFACDLRGSLQHMAAVVRGGLAGLAAAVGWPPPAPVPMTIVAAPTSVHATRALSGAFLPGRLACVTHAPVTAPFDELVAAVQSSQPLILVGYPSVIARLADVQSGGRLSISPMVVSVTSEQLTVDHVERITAGFGLAPTNSYGTTEGLMGTAPPGSQVFDFASDLAYVEFVDALDRPVDIGQPAHHVLVTNLFNHVQPLIRYRIDDVMAPAGGSPAHGHQRASVEGRNDEPFVVSGVTIHPLTIRSALLRVPSVEDYQVRIEPDAHVRVDLVARATPVDVAEIGAALTTALADAGAPGARVSVRVVDALSRDQRTGKTRRFVTA